MNCVLGIKCFVDNAWSPSEVVSGGNPAAASDWTSVRGWHPLGDKGTNKKVVRCLLTNTLEMRYHQR